MTDLSPAAQAVLNAANNAYWLWDQMCPADADVIAAAALRAAVDQVAPEEPLHDGHQRWMFERDARQGCRHQLLVFAAELEQLDD